MRADTIHQTELDCTLFQMENIFTLLILFRLNKEPEFGSLFGIETISLKSNGN